MADETRTWTVGALAQAVGGEVVGDRERAIERPVPAGHDDPAGITFAADEAHLTKAFQSSVGSVIVPPEVTEGPHPLIRCADPRQSFGIVLALMQRPLPYGTGVHPTSAIDPQATVHPDAWVGPHVVIERGAVIEEGARVYPFCYVGEDCVVGKDSVLYPHVVLYQDVRMGERCIVHSGAVIGADGFGFYWDGARQQKVPQVGGVVLGNDVEIGAQTCIDRATCGDTVIKSGAKLDNLIQIGHNVSVGSHTVMAAQAGISGSVSIGERVTMGGQVAVSHHTSVGDDIVLGGRSGVISDLTEPGTYFGLPPTPLSQAMRSTALQTRLPELFQRLRALEREVERLKHDGDVS